MAREKNENVVDSFFNLDVFPLSLQSPGSQEDQAKLLIEKLGEIQRNSHQQQLQYESCLDEVANRLVHTLLVQKVNTPHTQLLVS